MDLDPRVDENGIEHDVLGRARTRQAHGLAAQLGRSVDGVLVFRRDEDGYGRRRGQAEEERRGHSRDVTLTIGSVQRSGSQIGLPSREGLSGITLGSLDLQDDVEVLLGEVPLGARDLDRQILGRGGRTRYRDGDRGQQSHAKSRHGASDVSVKRRLLRLYSALYERYGLQGWWPARSAFEIAVGAMLTQHTAWPGAARGIANLRSTRRLEPRRVAALSPPAIGRLIRPAGAWRLKSRSLFALVAVARRHCRLPPLRGLLARLRSQGAATSRMSRARRSAASGAASVRARVPMAASSVRWVRRRVRRSTRPSGESSGWGRMTAPPAFSTSLALAVCSSPPAPGRGTKTAGSPRLQHSFTVPAPLRPTRRAAAA